MEWAYSHAIALFGFPHPQDLFRGKSFIDTFRSVWCFVSSMVFESQEAFAAYLGHPMAMETLQKSLLMEIKSQQQKMLGPERTSASIQPGDRVGGDDDLDRKATSHILFMETSDSKTQTELGASMSGGCSDQASSLRIAGAACGSCAATHKPHSAETLNAEGCSGQTSSRDVLGAACGSTTAIHEATDEGGSACVAADKQKSFLKWTPAFYGDVNADAGIWSAFAVTDSNTGARSCGNHICCPSVCHKRRLGKLGLCLFCFWSWYECTNAKNERVMRRIHGKKFQSRWDGLGKPPVHKKPPMKGAPKLERTHPLHFKMSPGVMLGPRCNHVLGIICKLPVLSTLDGATCGGFADGSTGMFGVTNISDNVEFAKTLLDKPYSGLRRRAPQCLPSLAGLLLEAPRDPESDALSTAAEEMVESIVAAEFYASDYAAKERPQAQGLFHTLHDSLLRTEQFSGTGEDVRQQGREGAELSRETARKLLQRLVAATNRRIHKGFPSIYAYVLGRPNHYASHDLVKYNFQFDFVNAIRGVYSVCGVDVCEDVAITLRTFDETGPVGEGRSDDCDAAKAEAVQDRLRAMQTVQAQRQGCPQTFCDYTWRPDVMESYFFQAGADIVLNRPRDGTYLWHEKAAPVPEARRRHPCYYDSAGNDIALASASGCNDQMALGLGCRTIITVRYERKSPGAFPY